MVTSAITAAELKKIIDMARKQGLRTLKVTVPSEAGGPAVLVDFTFRDALRSLEPETAMSEDEALSRAY